MPTAQHEQVSAAHHVLSTPELLELIISFLPPLQTLTTIRLVSRQFADTVAASPPLIRLSTWQVNLPAKYKPTALPSASANCGSFIICPLLQPMFRAFWRKIRSSRSLFRDPGYGSLDELQARLPNIYLTHPPLEQMVFQVRNENSTLSFHLQIINEPGGVTFARFINSILRTAVNSAGKFQPHRVFYGIPLNEARVPPWRRITIEITTEKRWIAPEEEAEFTRRCELDYLYLSNARERFSGGPVNIGAITALVGEPWETVLEEGKGGAWGRWLEGQSLVLYDWARGVARL
ncbi:hypothetical protein ABW19_dt0201652 [Dactylella cylindrospora]|nr:hypothetical protein ABW19_dt0201652 [Dactylella cylindrospora]